MHSAAITLLRASCLSHTHITSGPMSKCILKWREADVPKRCILAGMSYLYASICRLRCTWRPHLFQFLIAVFFGLLTVKATYFPPRWAAFSTGHTVCHSSWSIPVRIRTDTHTPLGDLSLNPYFNSKKLCYVILFKLPGRPREFSLVVSMQACVWHSFGPGAKQNTMICRGMWEA